jgi:hypothetical protein
MAGSREANSAAMKIIESGEVPRNDKRFRSARTENRQRICTIACGGLPLKQNPYFCGRERFAVIPGQPAGLSPESITPVVIFCSDVVS